MSNERFECCICHQPQSPPYHILGGRIYCARHYALVNKPHRGFWQASLIQILGMAALSAMLAWLGNAIGPLSDLPLLLAGIVLSVLPAALWLIFFYRQDRLEPEPKHKLAAVFLMALLLTDVIGRRAVEEWWRVSEWAAADTTTSLLAALCILGPLRQVIAYVAVRTMVYATDEFDERMDGIVYGTVAGLGVATLLNLRYVLASEGVGLAPGVITTATTALAQASFGGLMGYVMAEAKFSHRPIWFVPLGFAVTAALNGLVSWLIAEVSAVGLTVDPWRSLALGVAVALIAYLTLIALVRRSVTVTLQQS
ncbi:PrsW family glutamic-type intramembrane protease [uncultured Chloroflexus sp.]|uniref:PrsW family glutamic-type intramembrane protease n=1 Tax=uncultured Chloroflexus sp. TaxID=214040 RepID=UPI002611212A|nr:PrsW family glutamic-type intramembrane protease [uncultured Chloroflexus sp.]